MIQDAFTKEEGMLTPALFYDQGEQPFQTMIMTFSQQLIDSLLAEGRITPSTDVLTSINGDKRIYSVKDHPGTGLFKTGIGASLAVCTAEEVAHIAGSRNMKNALHGDFGLSLKERGRTVAEIISTKFPVSARIGGISIVLALCLGIPLGCVAALHRGKTADNIIIVFSTMKICLHKMPDVTSFSPTHYTQCWLNQKAKMEAEGTLPAEKPAEEKKGGDAQ